MSMVCTKCIDFTKSDPLLIYICLTIKMRFDLKNIQPAIAQTFVAISWVHAVHALAFNWSLYVFLNF